MGKRLEHPLDGDDVRYTVRVPPALYAEVARLSDEAGWSVHAEMLHALHEHVRRRKRVARPGREAS